MLEAQVNDQVERLLEMLEDFTYLNIEAIVQFYSLAKDEDILCNTGKLPHIAKLIQWSHLDVGLLVLHLVMDAFAGGHSQRCIQAASPDGMVKSRSYRMSRQEINAEIDDATVFEPHDMRSIWC